MRVLGTRFLEETYTARSCSHFDQGKVVETLGEDWGLGKTTLMLQIERQMRERERARQATDQEESDPARQVETLWFNAWKHPTDDFVFGWALGCFDREV